MVYDFIQLVLCFYPYTSARDQKNHILYQIMGDPNYKGKGCLYIQCSSHLNSEKKLRRGKISRISRKITVHIADLNFMCLFFYHTTEFLLLPNRALMMLIWSVIFFLNVLINHFKSLFSKFISIFKINFEICHWFEYHTLYKQIVIKSKKLDSSIADALLYFKGLFLNIHWRQIINPWAINVSKI